MRSGRGLGGVGGGKRSSQGADAQEGLWPPCVPPKEKKVRVRRYRGADTK